MYLLIPLATVLALEADDLYDRGDLVLSRSMLDEAPAMLQFAAVATSLAGIIGGQALEPLVLAALWIFLGAALVLGRPLARATIRSFLSAERCLVIGDAELATHVRRKVHASRARAEGVATLPRRSGESDPRLPRPPRSAHAHAAEDIGPCGPG